MPPSKNKDHINRKFLQLKLVRHQVPLKTSVTQTRVSYIQGQLHTELKMARGSLLQTHTHIHTPIGVRRHNYWRFEDAEKDESNYIMT